MQPRMKLLRQRMLRLAAKDKKRDIWWHKNVKTIVVNESDGQQSIFIHVPGFLKRYRTYKPVKDALQSLVWPSARTPIMMGNVAPRDILWFEKHGRTYTFSRRKFLAQPKWPEAFRRLRFKLNDELNRRTLYLQRKHKPFFRPINLNSVLVNRYKGPKDSISGHSDNEPFFGKNPTIVSISVGISRVFHLRRKTEKEFETDRKWSRLKNPCRIDNSDSKAQTQYSFALGDGDLMIMAGATQDYWNHRIDKDTTGTIRDTAVRYNMTWRRYVKRPSTKLPRKCGDNQKVALGKRKRRS